MWQFPVILISAWSLTDRWQKYILCLFWMFLRGCSNFTPHVSVFSKYELLHCDLCHVCVLSAVESCCLWGNYQQCGSEMTHECYSRLQIFKAANVKGFFFQTGAEVSTLSIPCLTRVSEPPGFIRSSSKRFSFLSGKVVSGNLSSRVILPPREVHQFHVITATFLLL